MKKVIYITLFGISATFILLPELSFFNDKVMEFVFNKPFPPKNSSKFKLPLTNGITRDMRSLRQDYSTTTIHPASKFIYTASLAGTLLFAILILLL